jgi:hypothetical protein
MPRIDSMNEPKVFEDRVGKEGSPQVCFSGSHLQPRASFFTVQRRIRHPFLSFVALVRGQAREMGYFAQDS